MPVQAQRNSVSNEIANVSLTALRAYRNQQNESDNHQRIISYLPLVYKIVHQIASYLRPSLSIDDLISAGSIGLIKAARDFDSSKDAEFKTYAYIRIRGAVIDELRNWSFAPPSLGKQMNLIEQFLHDTIEKTGFAPNDEQIAAHLGITIDKLYKTFEHARAGHFLSIHGLSQETPSLTNLAMIASQDDPHSNIEKSELLEQLAAAIQQLPKRQSQIIILYYNQQLTMKQIAQAMEITESRVSQLHASALAKLSAYMGVDNGR